VGYSLLLNPENVIAVEPDRVTIQGGETFGCIECEVGTQNLLLLAAMLQSASPDSLTFGV
jgi:hypothetical protein